MMKDIKQILKEATNKIKSAIEKKDIPVADAFAQMDADLAEAEKSYEYKFNENAENRISLEEFYLNILEFKNKPDFTEIKSRFEELVTKYNPNNFNSKEEQFAAAKKIDILNKAYSYFAEEDNKKKHRGE